MSAPTTDRIGAPTTDRIGAATVAEIREMLGGLADGGDMALLRRVFAYGRVNGWSTGWSGPMRQSKDRMVGVDWDTDDRQIGVTRHGPHFWMSTDWYPVTSVREAIDILVIEGVLPVEFSSMYAAGRADRAAGGER